MILKDNTVIFQSTPIYYEQERDGEKPNITRIIEAEDFDDLLSNYPTKIRIFSLIHNSKHYFDRNITNISKLWQMFDKVVVTISWQHVTEEPKDEKG